MLNFIFGRPDWQKVAEHNRRMAQRQAYAARFSQPCEFANCTSSNFPPPAQVVDLVEIDGVWQLPPDVPMHEAKAG